MRPTTVIALPQRKHIAGLLFLTSAFSIIFALLYGASSLAAAHIPWRFRVDFDIETAVPLLPAASTVYLSINLMLCLAPFILRDFKSLLPMFVAMVTQTAIAALLFIILPIETAFPERHVDGMFAITLAIADTLNLDNNYLPSLHVALAITAAIAYGKQCGSLGKASFAVWAMAISASTILIHEHHLLDILAGALLAFGTWKITTQWLNNEQVSLDIDIERFCYSNFLEFGRRHPRYLLIACVITGASLFRWRKRRILRTGFCFLQLVDDILDGDRACDEEPLARIDQLIYSIEHNQFKDDEIPFLAQAFRKDLLEKAGPKALHDAIELMRIMQMDRKRVKGQLLSSRKELRAQHRRTFQYSVNLMLMAIGSPLRAKEVPELIDAFGWCSVMRDLEEDLEAGLVNIPKDIVAEAVIEGASLSYSSLIKTQAVRNWISEELTRARGLLDQTDERLSNLSGHTGSKLLTMFARSIRKYEKRILPHRYSLSPP